MGLGVFFRGCRRPAAAVTSIQAMRHQSCDFIRSPSKTFKTKITGPTRTDLSRGRQPARDTATDVPTCMGQDLFCRGWPGRWVCRCPPGQCCQVLGACRGPVLGVHVHGEGVQGRNPPQPFGSSHKGAVPPTALTGGCSVVGGSFLARGAAGAFGPPRQPFAVTVRCPGHRQVFHTPPGEASRQQALLQHRQC